MPLDPWALNGLAKGLERRGGAGLSSGALTYPHTCGRLWLHGH